MDPKRKIIENAHRLVINSIFNELKKNNIKIADSAQSNLHKSIRECLLKHEEDISRLIEEQKKGNQKIIKNFTAKFEKENRKIRRSFLRRILDNICPIWPLCS